MISLPFICDLYNPILLVGALAFCATRLWKKQFTRASLFFISAFIAYGLMFLDNATKIWPRFGLDYSTHTATALVLCLYIGMNVQQKLWWGILGISLVSYGELMVILHYHSWADILTTAIPVGGIMALIYQLSWQHK